MLLPDDNLIKAQQTRKCWRYHYAHLHNQRAGDGYCCCYWLAGVNYHPKLTQGYYGKLTHPVRLFIRLVSTLFKAEGIVTRFNNRAMMRDPI